MDAILPYRSMAYNNGWANHRLLTACGRLTQMEFEAPRTGFFPSLRATLNHILIVDRFYVDRWRAARSGRPPVPTGSRARPWLSCTRRKRAWTGDWSLPKIVE